MIAKETLKTDEQVTIPASLAARIRKIAPYGHHASLDSYVSAILDEFMTELEGSRPVRDRYNPFSEKDLKEIQRDIQCYSLYA